MVRITPDATQNYRDNYDRILAHVHLPGGKLFAEEMIQE
jgi:endonuclease YncB( thermonuclease family)